MGYPAHERIAQKPEWFSQDVRASSLELKDHPLIANNADGLGFTGTLHMGGCHNSGPFLGTLNIRCRIIIGTQKGTIILITTHM